jgi:hypothetical protein
MTRTVMDNFIDMLAEVYEYRDSDPRRARFLRDRLYMMALEAIAKDNSSLSRDRMVQYAQTALQAEDVEIAPMPRVPISR